mgnify:CR=1 FL=1
MHAIMEINAQNKLNGHFLLIKFFDIFFGLGSRGSLILVGVRNDDLQMIDSQNFGFGILGINLF